VSDAVNYGSERVVGLEKVPGTFCRLRQTLVQEPLTRHWFNGRIAMIARIAACITLVAAVGIIPLSNLWRRDTEGTLLAEMVENVKKAKNVSLHYKGKGRSTDDGKKMPYRESAYREWIDASGSSRQELDRGIIAVVNRKEKKVMHLNTKSKKANIISIPEDEPFDNVYENLKNLKLENLETVPEKEIDGRMAIGFVMPTAKDKEKQIFMPGVKVWVDQKTKLPIRIEGSFGRDKDDPDHAFVIDQIVFDDPKVNASLFEIKVPEGYTLQDEHILKFTPGTKAKGE
jgi:hypothetical protein